MEIQRGVVITVDRGGGKLRAGQGMLKAMLVIWKHWQGSFKKNSSFGQIHGTFTVEYPEERVQLPETARNMPILLFDDATGHELCTSCFQCQRICPPQVIHMTQERDPVTGKALPAVAEFIIEYDACMSCGFCAEVCPFDAIKMDHDFELSTDVHGGLTVRKEQLNRPVSYYARIAPRMWAEVQAGAEKKLQSNIKRRPGLVGIAPQLVEQIRSRRQETAPVGEVAQPEPLAAPLASPAPVAPPAAQVAKATPEEKAARLAAIRAKAAAAAASVEDNAAPAAQVGQSMSDEKAARLAAIRAKAAAAATPPEDNAAPERSSENE